MSTVWDHDPETGEIIDGGKSNAGEYSVSEIAHALKRTLEDADIKDGDLENALAIMRKHQALEDTIERARHYGAMARDALQIFPDSKWRQALFDVVEFCVSRAH